MATPILQQGNNAFSYSLVTSQKIEDSFNQSRTLHVCSIQAKKWLGSNVFLYNYLYFTFLTILASPPCHISTARHITNTDNMELTTLAQISLPQVYVSLTIIAYLKHMQECPVDFWATKVTLGHNRINQLGRSLSVTA